MKWKLLMIILINDNDINNNNKWNDNEMIND